MEPISSYLRPQTLDDFVGQQHLVWLWMPIHTFLEENKIPSMIFRWSPGSWKTTLAHIISKKTNSDFLFLSWVSSKKEDLKKMIEKAETNQQYGKQTIVFLDEIHRRNKAQQDTLLPYVEKWTITLIWATTENPSFTINNALISRCRVFIFNPLSEEEIFSFIKNNLDKILTKIDKKLEINDEQINFISQFGNWDLRNSLNILEVTLLSKKEWTITNDDIINAWQKMVYHDKNWENHYNIISAIHKSLRDSDWDAACYRIQRMLSAGEDPLYVARRLLRFASEDIWIANNNALLLANQTYEAISKIWMPECDVFLFHLATYLAQSPKNNIAYKISKQTKKDVEIFWNLPVPMHLRNAPTKLMKEVWYGKDYKYFHDDPSATGQQHFPDELKDRNYW